jgi:TonB family protein
MAKSTIGFSVYLNGKLVEELKFDRPIINIGKLSTSTLRVDDVNVSRKHAVIERKDDGGWRITDLGSTNGTVLRGERIVQTDLRDGDRLVLGTTTIVVRLDDAMRARPSEPVAGSTAEVVREVPSDAAQAIVKPEEIRGLGADSFYKKRAAAEGRVWAVDVAVLWGETVLSSQSFRGPEPVVLGEGPTSNVHVPPAALGSATYTLVTQSDKGFALNLGNPNIEGDVLVDGAVKPITELAETSKSMPLKGAVRARLRIGEFTVLVSHSPLQGATTPPSRMDAEPLIYIGAAAVVVLIVVLSALLKPEDALLSTRDPRAQRQKVLQALKITPEDLEEKAKQEAKKVELDKTKQRTTEVADELKVNPSEVPMVADARPDTRDRNPLVDKMARKPREDLTKLSPEARAQRAKELAQSTAMNQNFRESNPLFSELLQTNPDLDAKPSPFKSVGVNVADGTSNFYETGGNLNPFGGSFDPASGGFLPSDGGLPTGGPDGGPVVADILGKQRGDLNDLNFNDKPADPRIMELPPRLSGELDEKTVQQYIRRYLSGIKWCYQDRLQSNRKLGGKVTLAFTILPNGGVIDARTMNSSLGDADLEQCIATKMARWKFPSPKDGGTVEVAYPLILKTQ